MYSCAKLPAPKLPRWPWQVPARKRVKMKVGYARASTHDQNQELQTDALEQAGCKKIFSDKLSGAICSRLGLNAALNYAQQNDCFVVWRLDRLGRSLENLIQLVEDLNNKGVVFISLNEGIDTTTNGEKLISIFSGHLPNLSATLSGNEQKQDWHGTFER